MRGLVATHGNLGAELVKVVEMIMGPGSGLTSLTNHGKSAPDLVAEMRDWLDAEDGGEGLPVGDAVLFLDDYGGSCAHAAQLACRAEDPVAIISGVNLAMLLGFVTWRDDLDLAELSGRLVSKGREAITRLGGSP
ncbi:hypothetical protein GW813_14920 [bacterium]|nr:hypothetical protein [bacterium]PJA76170.1 MAG: hypothetical protein CO151_03470 [bacterium CG_4_9_14_3_um_filter_65_15]